MDALLLIVGSVAVALAIQVLFFKKRSTYKLPPGPSGVPILGNVLQVPTEVCSSVYFIWALC